MKPGPLLFAVLAAGMLVRRWGRTERVARAAGVLVVAGLVVYGSGLIHPPALRDVVQDAGDALGRWTYLVVAVMAFLETGAFVGLVAPGETFMVLGGVVAGQGTISLPALIAIAWAAAVAGDLASFYAGRRLGRAFLVRHGPRVAITEERLRYVEAFFARHGGAAILLGRFVGVVRAVNPFLAGASGMRLRRFVPFDVVGAGAWATTLIVLGYVFWRSFDRVLHYSEQGALALGTTIVVVAALVWLGRTLRDPARRRVAGAWLDRQLRRPALRPLAAVARPAWTRVRGPLGVVGGRLASEVGRELAALLAVACVGTGAFVGNLVALHGARLVVGDRLAYRWADDVRSSGVDAVARVVTHLGSSMVVGPAVLVTVVVLVVGRRGLEAATLGVGALLTYAAVNVTKAAESRPRPPRQLVDTAGDSYPSGHTAYAVAWVAIAVLLTRTHHGAGRPAAAVAVAVLVVALVGLTRIELRAHYLSDVVGGAGLAAALLALCGVGGLVVARVRHNGVRA